MEEVDNIIIHTFKQIGCDIPEEVSSLKEFTTALIVSATSKCLRMIKEDLQIPSVLPASMSSRFRLGTTLATACREVGYRGEIGYQTFLYSNEAEIRKLFMFLVENLPKESSESASEPLGSSVMLNRRISSELSKRLSRPWTPSFLKKNNIGWTGGRPQTWHREGARSVRRFCTCTLRIPEGLGDLTRKIPKDVKAYYNNSMPFITSQPHCYQDIAPSVLEENSEYLAQKRERLEKKIKQHLQSELQRTNVNAAKNIDLSDVVSSLSDSFSQGAAPSKGSRFTRTEQLQFAQTTEQISSQKSKNAEQEEIYKVKKRSVDLLPDAQNNISKLQSVVDSSAQRLVILAQQWESHRVPLIDQYRELKQLNANRVVVEYETMRKDVNRSAYTSRILEIVGNIEKQREEIKKILIDTKAVQKEINQLSGKLDRTFSVTDELIFRDARKDESCRKAYKYLASLHQNCKDLISSVEETGLILREIRDLEDQIEMESQKNTATNLERITADYKQIKDENNALTKKLKAATK
ncbi:Coiled-coil domain-containing protein 22-like protein [Acropora cervicornis]|uniref:Coiled-coil domain-containing protein 22-like protein n=1 Tax=Acropora cervicornis TaxID=6130 RepID=A0AAD9PV81_ACRCE|nr:Coiled-coil domain-containing protein 22-like protein [Acropora cervicornis]